MKGSLLWKEITQTHSTSTNIYRPEPPPDWKTNTAFLRPQKQNCGLSSGASFPVPCLPPVPLRSNKGSFIYPWVALFKEPPHDVLLSRYFLLGE